MVRTALDCIITVDAQDRIIEFNVAAERTFGYRREDVLGRDLPELIIPAPLRARHRAAMAKYLETGEKTILDRRVEVSALRADGEEFPVELTVTRITQGGPPIFTAYVRDISRRRETENALRESEQRFSELIAQIRDYAIFMMDPERRATTWNEGVKRVLGFDRDEFLGLDVVPRIFTPEDVRDGVADREFEKALAQGAASDDRWMMRKDGERFFALGVTLARRDAEGRLLGFAKIMRDRTEHKRLENELRETADRLAGVINRQTEFLGMLSHELRNPLAPIKNGVELLKMRPDEAESVVRVSEMMGRQIGHLVRLVDDLLDITRVSQGKIELQMATIDVRDAVRDAVEVAHANCASSGQSISADLPARAVHIDADHTRVVQMIGNLLHNACKFTPRGGRIGVSLREEDPHAVIRVRDTGVGIQAQHLANIFEMFTQIDSHLGPAKGGLGIGLSLTRRLVELHGGSIEAHSEGLGHGSEFVLSLPLRAAA